MRLPPLPFTITENTRTCKTKRVEHRRTAAAVRWSSRSRDGFDKCYTRLNQPMDMSLAAAESARRNDSMALPFRLYEEHDVHPNPDWEGYEPANKFDWKERQRLMATRNIVIQHQLQEGNPVQFRCWGPNMHPRAHEGDWVIFEPVLDLSELQVGDIVFCRAGGTFTYRAQTITGMSAYSEAIAAAQGTDYDIGWRRYIISAQKGNKFIDIIHGHNMFGRLVEVIYT